MSSERIGAVILSAGYSSRMKCFKPLLLCNYKYAILRCIDLFKSVQINNIFSVVGYNSEELIRVIKQNNSNFAMNTNYDKGMYSSIVCGIKAFPEDLEGFFLLPVDICALRKVTIEKLINAHKENMDCIIYPVFDGKRGHPPFIPSTLFKDIIDNEGIDGGVATVLNKYDKKSINVEVIDRGILMDMDTKEAYDEICEFLSRQYIDEYEINYLYSKYDVPINIREHCKKVSSISEEIALLLNCKGFNLDIELIKCAALLHDIAKGEKLHARLGKEILTNYGFERIGDIIGEHMDIRVRPKDTVSEEEVVYLSDKMVKGTRIVTIDERIKIAKDKFQGNEDAINSAMLRIENAKIIKQKIEKLLGTVLNF